MTVRRLFLGSLVLPGVVFLFGACTAPGFSVEPRYGKLSPEGDFTLANSGQPLIQNSISDLDVDGGESSPGARADLTFAIQHLTLSTEGAEWSGSGLATGFGAITGAVDSELDVAIHRALFTFDVLPIPMVELGLGLGASVIDIRSTVTETVGANSEEIDEVFPIPVLVARLGVDVWRLEFEALVSGFSVRYDGDKAAYFDTELAARMRLFNLGPVDALLSLGYRRIDLAAEYEDAGDSAELDLTLDGFMLGLKLGV